MSSSKLHYKTFISKMTFLSGKARCFFSSLPSLFPGVEYFNERFIFLRLCLETEPMKGTEFRIMASQHSTGLALNNPDNSNWRPKAHSDCRQRGVSLCKAFPAESVIFFLFSYCYTGRWLFLLPSAQGGDIFCEKIAPSLKSDEICGATLR